jgi:Rrf2 family transcriptional regulator, iron-sulfur cluster assembly transcription factor
VPVLSRRGILAIAAVVDIALQKDGRPVTAKALAARHGLPSRYLELLLQRLVRDDILKGFRGQRGGYRLVREQSGVTANDILRTATKHATEEETNSDLVTKVVIPILSPAEHEFGQALSRITLDDIVTFAKLSGFGAERRESQPETMLRNARPKI